MQIGRLLVLFYLFSNLLGTSNAATTNSLSQWNISWQFSNDCVYGTFVNGDYWVVAPVVITNMTPAWDGVYNGWEINPLPTRTNEGFTYTTRTTNLYSASVRPDMPFTLTTNCSLVKTVGQTNLGITTTVSTAAVLTVLTAAPPNDGADIFRPPYVGTNKPLYSVGSILSNLLPRYATVSNAPTLGEVYTNFSKCLRMDHHPTAPRWFRPSSAMDDYQPGNTVALNEAMLRLMLDDNYATKLPALIQFTQHTIDQAHAIFLGYRRLDDGHNPNHRVLGAWAASLLDINDIKTYLSTATGFHEDYYLSAGSNKVIWGEAGSELSYWNYIISASGSRSIKDPYHYIDGGKLGGSSYQPIVSQSLKGQALIYRLFPTLTNCITVGIYTNLFDYAERWVTNGIWAIPDPAAPYDGVPSNYGITFGPNGLGSFIPGSGRFPAQHGNYKDAGQYKSDFVASMWDAYVAASTNMSFIMNGKATFRGKATIR